MALNIKNAQAEREIGELAIELGVSKTAAVQAAVREKLAAVRRGEDRDKRLADLLGIARKFRASLSAEELRRLRNIDTELYDENGLPK